MRKFLNISAVFAVLSLVSCDRDLLEPFTPGALTEEVAIQTSSELQQLLNSTYANMNSRSESEFVSVFTDEVGIGYANGGQGVNSDFVFFLNQSSDGPNSLWVGSYTVLSRANRVLKFVDKIVATDAADQEKLAGIKAQALVIRAYSHLKLLSYFTTNMKDNNALAAVLADHVFLPEEKTNPRATNGQFYSFIHNDLDNAIALYNANPGLTISNIGANANFAKGLKARAYAYKGDYTNAELWADQVIATSGLSLATPAQYKQMFFSDTNSSEVIFKLKRMANQNSQGFNLHNAWCSIRPNLTGSPFYEVGRSLHNVLNPTNMPANTIAANISDVRANVIIAPSSIVDPNYATSADYRNSDKIIINKHGGTTSGSATWATAASNANNNDIKVMRLSEMYLIKAEARANAGDYPGAALAVQAVRIARNSVAPALPVYANATDAWAGILKERRIEFAYEGYRFLDLKRLGALAGMGIDRDPADYSSSSANYPGANPSNFPITSYKWALPIPSNELNVNSGIQQNPGY